ncbi:MAG: tetratricopeptide repeat protein [Nitrospinales bacterium]
MSNNDIKRKLTVILSADVEGYSLLMGDDEESTIRTLDRYRQTMKILIEHHRGRVVDATGDNLLAEYASVVDAVNCAATIQQKLAELNAGLPEKRKMQFRIGVNLGDVVEEGDRIYGDGVNIAARIEGLAVGGGICISGTAYDQVKSKLVFGYEYTGEHTVKNIKEPLRVYRVLMEPEAAGKLIGETKSMLRRWSLASAVIVLVIGATAIWVYYMRLTPNSEETISPSKSALLLVGRASIAVLPFSNLSGEPEQEYFSDGITNDLITALSKFPELLVIASNTIFTYKGKPVNIEHVGQELGVRYVLEGSVQKAGAKVRINAQLIDATSGFHIWSEHYNRELKDIFAVQEEIVHTIVGKLAVKIDAAERKRVLHKRTESLEAYDYLLRGLELFQTRTCADFRKARQMFEKAIALDPDFASAYVGLGRTYQSQISYGCTEFPSQTLQRAKDLATKAIKLDEFQSDAYALLGMVYTYSGRYDLAISQLNQAIEINPNDAYAHSYRGQVMLWSGRVDDAIQSMEIALRFDPNRSPGDFMFLGIGYYLKGQYDKAINVLEKGLNRKLDWVGNHIILAAAYAQLDRSDDAEREVQEILRLEPFFELDNYGTVYRNQADRAKIVQGLRKAGLN